MTTPSLITIDQGARLTSGDDPITLKDAAQHFGFTVWTLRAEADRGNLEIYKIGKRFYTTPNDIREMILKCRVAKKDQGSISFPRRNNGSSETERASSARAAANEIALKLRSGSRNTLAESTSRNHQVRR